MSRGAGLLPPDAPAADRAPLSFPIISYYMILYEHMLDYLVVYYIRLHYMLLVYYIFYRILILVVDVLVCGRAMSYRRL